MANSLGPDGLTIDSINDGQIGGRRNLIINGDFKVNQRGDATGATNTAYRGPDRFRTSIFSAGTWSVSQSSDVPSGQGFSNSFKMDCTTADTSLSGSHHVMVQYGIEGQDIQHLCYGSSSAKKVTLSFWVKSNKTGTYSVEFEETGNTRHICATYTISSANTWEKKTITIDGDTASALADDNTLEFRVIWALAVGPDFTSGTHNTSAWASQTTANRFSSSNVNLADSTSNDWYITGIQLEVGDTATDFEHRTYAEELLSCMRYFEGSTYARLSATGFAGQIWTMKHDSSTRAFPYMNAEYRVIKRVIPTITMQSSQDGTADELSGYSSGTNYTISALSLPSKSYVCMYFQMTDSLPAQVVVGVYQADAEL